jgi:hypothetical protein
MTYKCKVAIFYESHNDASTATAILDTLEFLSKCGFTSFAAEEPYNRPLLEFLGRLKVKIKLWVEVTKLDYLNGPLLQKIMERLDIRIDNLEKAFKMIQHYSEENVKADFATVSLLEKLNVMPIKYFAVDIPENDKHESMISRIKARDYRDNIMQDNVYKVATSNGPVIFQVGLAHYKIAKMLRDKDCVVKEYFITAAPVNQNSGLAEAKLFTENTPKGIKFREENFKDGIVLDLYKNPDLNVSQVIIKDLSGSLICLGQENSYGEL